MGALSPRRQLERSQVIDKIPECSVCHIRCDVCHQLGQCCLTTARTIKVSREEQARDDDLDITVSREAEPGEEEVD